MIRSTKRMRLWPTIALSEVQKPIVMGDVDDPSIRVSRRIEKLLDPAVVLPW